MKTILIPILLCLLVGSCSKPVESVIRRDAIGEPNLVDDRRIKLRESSLTRKVRVLSVFEGKEGELIKIQVNLKNVSRSPITIQYAFEWLDSDGFNSRPEKTWLTKTLRSGEPETVARVADNPKAVDFLFHMKKSDN